MAVGTWELCQGPVIFRPPPASPKRADGHTFNVSGWLRVVIEGRGLLSPGTVTKGPIPQADETRENQPPICRPSLAGLGSIWAPTKGHRHPSGS